MPNMLTAEVVIRGTRPLWQNRFGPEAMPLEKQERTGVAGNNPEEWRKTCMVDKSGQLYVDPTYIFATMREAARYTKRGRGSIQVAVSATLQVEDDRVLLDRWMPEFPNGHSFDPMLATPPPNDLDLPVYLDIRGVRNPVTKARNVRYRIAASRGWMMTFHVSWDKTIVSRGEMEAVVIDAGKLVGVGNGRSIGMGRFEIVSFTISE